MGQMDSAYNSDAQVRRTYYPNGQIKTDTLRIRTLAPLSSGGSFEPHAYGLQYSYDLDGRRTQLRHPGTIAPVVGGITRDLTTYDYFSLTGDLRSVTDPLGNEFTLAYHSRGLLSSVTRPGEIFETFGYDGPGRLTSNRVTSTSSSEYAYYTSFIRTAALNYDVRDKLVRVRSGGGVRDTLFTSYSPLGHVATGTTVAHSRTAYGQDGRSILTEQIDHDAMGNQVESLYSEEYTGPGHSTNSLKTQGYRYQNGTGRLVNNPKPYQLDSIYYDGAGNEIFRTDYPPNNDPRSYYKDRASYYAADGTLRAADARYVSTASITLNAFFTGAFEEYRYDPLGRMILNDLLLCEAVPPWRRSHARPLLLRYSGSDQPFVQAH